ncbi:hypothetical protein CCACVL1_13472 [Corchorus capsularis]|uniref:Uncharacterized protein n=1 Tax=Corchorus capsularis TaxID=210143 RepID=A0A1R3IAZ4_COCAP|nr:hypothetical protein CCACVL1_13472 [Corchorus capsularis]
MAIFQNEKPLLHHANVVLTPQATSWITYKITNHLVLQEPPTKRNKTQIQDPTSISPPGKSKKA